MGQTCNCTGVTMNDKNTDGCQDLALSEQNSSFISQKNNKIRKETKSNLNSKLPSIGEELSEKEFNDIIGEEFTNYTNVNPYDPEYDCDTTTLVNHLPIKFFNTPLYYFGYWNAECQPEGPGRLYNKDDGSFVDGVWNKGELVKGRIMFNEGIYEGEIENNEMHGKGKIKYKDGREYEGDFVNGEREGSGKLNWEDGTNYWGEFKGDEINGNGEFNWNNGYSYKGDFVNGVFDGKGTLKGSNGSVYTGEFKKGIYHGKGKFIWGPADKGRKEKEMYVGNYVYGKKSGKGKYYFLNKDVFIGEWSDNRPHGQGKLEKENEIYKCFWRNGEIVEAPSVHKKNMENSSNNINSNEDEDEGEIKNMNESEMEKIGLKFTAKMEDIDFSKLSKLNFEILTIKSSIKQSRIVLKPEENIKDSLFPKPD